MSAEDPQVTQGLQTAPKAVLTVGQHGLQLNTLDDAWRFCQHMAASNMMPKGMDTAQQILFALELGFEVGLPPLAAVQSIAVINGRASLYGDVMLGLCLASGKFDEDAFEENWITGQNNAVIGAYCIVRRLPKGKPRRWDFTIEDAKTAGLWGKQGPWTTAPKRMLQMRARAFALRDVFPDVIKGIISREEAKDLPPEENITSQATVTRPTSLDDLTEQISAQQEQSAPVQETVVTAAPEQAKAEPAPKAKKKETAPVVASPPAKPETAPTGPPPKPKAAEAPVETVPATEQSAPVVEDSAPKGKLLRDVQFPLELHVTDEFPKHTAAQLADANAEAVRLNVNLGTFVEKRLQGRLGDFNQLAMSKLIEMLKKV